MIENIKINFINGRKIIIAFIIETKAKNFKINKILGIFSKNKLNNLKKRLIHF
jgi:hypothetical protein